MKSVAGVLLVAMLAPGCGGRAPAEPGPPAPVSNGASAVPLASSFIVGVASRSTTGGQIEPIARFNGTDWINTWPAPAEMTVPAPPLDQIPDAWLGRPVPREWTLWSPSGVTSRVRIDGARRGDGCEALIELTIQAGAITGMMADPLYLAADSEVRFGMMRSIARSDQEWAGLEPVILEAFHAHEREAFESDVVLQRRLSLAQLANRPIAIDYLVRPVASEGVAYYYFEADKKLADSDDGLAVSGWLRQDAGGRWTAVNADGRGLGGDSAPLPQRRPLATIRLGTRNYWIVDLQGYEGAAVAIVELTPDGVKDILTVARGGC